MKLLPILILLSLPCFAQDSLQTYPVPRWQIWRLIHETEQNRAKDSVIEYMNNSLNATLEAQVNLELQIKSLDKQIEVLILMNDNWSERYDLQGERIKEERGKKRKAKFVAIVEGVVILVIVVFNR